MSTRYDLWTEANHYWKTIDMRTYKAILKNIDVDDIDTDGESLYYILKNGDVIMETFIPSEDF